jgi:hypothetical protein
MSVTPQIPEEKTVSASRPEGAVEERGGFTANWAMHWKFPNKQKIRFQSPITPLTTIVNGSTDRDEPDTRHSVKFPPEVNVASPHSTAY